MIFEVKHHWQTESRARVPPVDRMLRLMRRCVAPIQSPNRVRFRPAAAPRVAAVAGIASEVGALPDEHRFFARDCIGNAGPAPRALEGLAAKVLRGLTENVYLSIDLDVFDPSIMGSVGTPEPGGLGWYDVVDLASAVVRERTVVGFDLCELMPRPCDRAPDFLAARLAYRLMASMNRKRADGRTPK